jgi:hypothetical protein
VKRAGITSLEAFCHCAITSRKTLACFIFPYSEFRNIPSRGSELVPCLAFLWEKLGILKETRERPVARSSASNPRAGKSGFCNSFRRPFLIAGPAACKNGRSLVALGFRRTAIHFCICPASRLAGIFRVQELRTLDFIGSRKRDEPTTRNIPELGISYSVNGILPVSCSGRYN